MITFDSTITRQKSVGFHFKKLISYLHRKRCTKVYKVVEDSVGYASRVGEMNDGEERKDGGDKGEEMRETWHFIAEFDREGTHEWKEIFRNCVRGQKAREEEEEEEEEEERKYRERKKRDGKELKIVELDPENRVDFLEFGVWKLGEGEKWKQVRGEIR